MPLVQPPDQAEKHMSQREREPERQHTFYNKPIPKRHVWGSERASATRTYRGSSSS